VVSRSALTRCSPDQGKLLALKCNCTYIMRLIYAPYLSSNSSYERPSAFRATHRLEYETP
jgi:hypothetical protein